MKDWEIVQTSLSGIAKKAERCPRRCVSTNTEASVSEEPGAVVSHAGICVGSAG